MNTKRTLALTATILAASLVACGPAAFAASVGVNFVNDGNGGVSDNMPNSLVPAETAGASSYAQANWNNLGR